MAIEYERINWKNNSTDTPVNAENLNKMDAAIDAICKNLGNLKFGIDADGNYGYYKTDGTFVPF